MPSEAIAGSTIFRRTEIFERVSAFTDRFSTHGVFVIQSNSTFALLSARAISAFRPPTDFAQLSVSSQSSTHSVDGVLMVSPSKMPSLSLPPLVMRKIFGSGHGGE